EHALAFGGADRWVPGGVTHDEPAPGQVRSRYLEQLVVTRCVQVRSPEPLPERAEGRPPRVRGFHAEEHVVYGHAHDVVRGIAQRAATRIEQRQFGIVTEDDVEWVIVA